MKNCTNYKEGPLRHAKALYVVCASIIVFFIFPLSCKKYIDQQKENALMAIVTKGQWQVTGFLDHETNITDSFADYAFQFNVDGTVYGIRNGEQTNGVWSADVGNKTITSNFASASYPVSMLNHVWKITDSYADSVAAKAAVDSGFDVLNLRKIK